MKKLALYSITAALVTSFCISVFAGCGAKNPIENPGEDYDANINLDYDTEGELRIGITTEGTESVMLEALIEEYNQVYPNVTVSFETIQDPYNNSLVLKYAADTQAPGTMPDILMSNSSDMHPLVSSGILLDIQPYIDAEVKSGGLNLDDYYEEMWLLGQEGFDGDQYLIPRSSDRVVTHINEKIFTDCFSSYVAQGNELPFTPIEGTYVPQNGWTWDEFLATCKVLRAYYDANGKGNLYLIDAYLSWEAVAYPIFRSNGSEIMDRTTGEIKLDNEGTKSAISMMQYMIDNRYCASFNSSAQANYEGGQGAMMFHSAYASRWYKSLGDDYNLTTFPLIGDQPYIGTGVAGYGIYSRSSNRDLAWTFLRFILTLDGQEALAGGGMTTNPIRKDMSDPSQYVWGKELVEKGINMSAYTYGTQYCIPTDFFTYYDSDIYSDLWESVSTMVVDALGSMSVDEAIRKAVDNMEYTIDFG